MKCLVIGAGPSGALSALYAARRGWDVHVYELRGDLRNEAITPLNFTKSINLALSERGINAMRHSGSESLLENVLADTIPMYGRMIHGADKFGGLTEASQQYDVHGRFIRAVDRAKLNKLLLDEIERLPNVKLYFNYKLTGADFKRKKAWFEHNPHLQPQQQPSPERPKEGEVAFDIMLGCDGAHSAARYHLMKYTHMDYEQRYIDALWCEFHIPPARDFSLSGRRMSHVAESAKDGFAISPNHLHIWPGSDQMFIAIPSLDKSFTCTLFAPAATFSYLEQHPEQVEPFFQRYFPGAADLIGPADLRRHFEANPHLPLISIKCSPHHYEASGVVLGDAANAMVPFYGQGMNTGLESVRVLFSHIDAHPHHESGIAAALLAYTEERVPDAHTINDLALTNYWEMHAGVQSSLYLWRKRIEEFLSDKVPSTGFATQYSRVSFSNQRFSEVSRVVTRQGKILLGGMLGSVLLPAAVWTIVWLSRMRGSQKPVTMLWFDRIVERARTVLVAE